MICSMTGYGSGKAQTAKTTIEVELRSVNGRSRDIRFNFPREFSALENTVRELIKKHLSRGQISVFVKYNKVSNDVVPYDKKQICDAVAEFKELAKSAGLSPEGNLDTLFRFPANNNIG